MLEKVSCTTENWCSDWQFVRGLVVPSRPPKVRVTNNPFDTCSSIRRLRGQRLLPSIHQFIMFLIEWLMSLFSAKQWIQKIPQHMRYVSDWLISLLPTWTENANRTWRVGDREYTLTATTFTKRNLLQHEVEFNIANALFTCERLENEYYALRYIAENSTIPVPKVIDFYQENGSLHLVTERLKGTLLCNIEDDEQRMSALSRVERILHGQILPQLRSLRRKYVGSAGDFMPVIPPVEALEYIDEDGLLVRTSWPCICSSDPEFVFCHNDLAQHNIMVHPTSHDLLAIIDWEYSSFFPGWFETARRKQEALDRDYAALDEFAANVERFFSESAFQGKIVEPSNLSGR